MKQWYLIQWKKISDRIFYRFYFVLQRFSFTRNYVNQIVSIYRMIKPTDEYTLILNATKLNIIANLISIILFLFSVNQKGSTTYHLLMVITIFFVTHTQLIQNKVNKEEYKLLKQFEQYLGEFKHYFYKNANIEDAIYDSLFVSKYEISLHIQKIYDFLVEDDELALEKYKEVAPNYYFLTFCSLCFAINTYGDSLFEDKSIFLTNLNNLKDEVNQELLKRDKIKQVFSGLIFLSLFPIFSLNAIERWSTSNLSELEKYYNGVYGLIVTVIIFFMTLLSYCMIRYLKDSNKHYRKHHFVLEWIGNRNLVNHFYQSYLYSKPASVNRMDTLLKRISEGITVKQYLIQKSLIFLISMFVITILLFHMNKIERYNTLNEIPDFEMNIVRMNGQNHMNYNEVIKKYAKQYRKMLPRINRNQILNTLEKQYNIKNQYVANVLVDEIVRRLSKYNKYHYRWYYIPISFLLSFVFCNIPYFILNLKKHLLQATMEEEVIQFQSIILVLMYVKRMNVETILRWLENFSCVFHPAIIRCIDDYSYNEKEAFAKLKEEEPFLPFVRLVENFESCDKIGIEKAFEGIASERKISLEKRKQENDFRIMNHAAIGKIFAYLPLILVLVLYLIIPFVLESLEQLMNNMNQLQGI